MGPRILAGGLVALMILLAAGAAASDDLVERRGALPASRYFQMPSRSFTLDPQRKTEQRAKLFVGLANADRTQSFDLRMTKAEREPTYHQRFMDGSFQRRADLVRAVLEAMGLTASDRTGLWSSVVLARILGADLR